MFSLLRRRKKKSQKWFQNGHFGVQVRPAQPSLTHLGAMLGHLEAMWVTCGATLPNLGVTFAELGPMLACLGAMLAPLGTILAHLGAHVGPSWGYVRPTWTHVGAYVGPSGPIRAQVEPKQRTYWRATKHRKIQCFAGSAATTPKPCLMLTLPHSYLHPKALS